MEATPPPKIMMDQAYDAMSNLSEVYWWFLARREILAAVIKPLDKHGGQLLDFGAGSGINARYLQSQGFQVTAAEVAPKAIESCRQYGLRTIDLSREILPLNTFDVILLGDVLEHFEDDRGLLESLAKHLKDGGHFVIAVPAYRFLWSGEDFVSRHIRRYTKSQLQAVVELAGFRTVRATYFNFFLFPVIVLVIFAKRWLRPGERYKTNLKPLPTVVNWVLLNVFKLEKWFVNSLGFPFGASVLVVAQKPQN